jgi:hypothetical protein
MFNIFIIYRVFTNLGTLNFSAGLCWNKSNFFLQTSGI